ncbi:hypothetical protein O5O45_08685 [Hahella aquimaris]|uniref:hypothetical protein n=1 Tax=Hahella sp. HNIBRBA332 TaxID=3015983 RepID=UPI00273BECAA|nr:hypothetical protein [Hahella sp. HNIBRBA332]WLQ15988.1 hypothetical protein O5O45_08685 [Hahella sp. HNIBRBA332]
MEQLNVFQEHGGVLYTKAGRALITFFGYQIDTKEGRLTIRPTSVEVDMTVEEERVLQNYMQPLEAKHLYSKARSAINEMVLLDTNKTEKTLFLKKLNEEIGALINET